MKSIALPLFIVAGLASVSAANLPLPTAYQIVTQGPDQNVWQRKTYERGPDGKIIPRVHQYTELATGLNYQDTNGQWLAAEEEITILPDGTAAAERGQHKAYFPADIYNGVIKLVTPNGQVMQSQPAALSYSDGANTALIAVLTNSTGYLVGSNQVIYPNAFAGLDADLRLSTPLIRLVGGMLGTPLIMPINK